MKNLISDWKSLHDKPNILVPEDYEYDGSQFDSVESTDLYERCVNYWYFSEIGFDSDEIFIKRFNDIYYANIDRYNYILNAIKDKGYSWEVLTRNGTMAHNGTDTDRENGSRTTTHSKSGQDIFRKGVTTTSEQDTSNEGSKLGRNTPNENLSVEGSSTTTVTDSGEDTTVYGGVDNVTETPNVNKEKTYNSSVTNDSVETREKLTLDEVKALQSMRSIYKEFALLFENLFMGVF